MSCDMNGGNRQSNARGVRIAAVLLGLALLAGAASLPAAPAEDSMAKAADVETYFRTRALIGTARAQEAHADDVPPREVLQIAPRFTYLLGITLTRGNAPPFLPLMEQVRADAEALLTPLKKNLGSGGRQRPFVEYPQLPRC